MFGKLVAVFLKKQQFSTELCNILDRVLRSILPSLGSNTWSYFDSKATMERENLNSYDDNDKMISRHFLNALVLFWEEEEK